MKKFYIISFLIILVAITGFLFRDKNAQATSVDNIYGYAWSSNIGWIGFNNCSDLSAPTPVCSGQNFGVRYDPNNNGNINGYAWSSNIGWIQFGGLSGFPTGGSSQINAKLDLTTGVVTGWAKALSFSNDTESVDWADGWISLDGVNFNLITGDGSGYAWGSNVIGWIDFSQVKIIPVSLVDLCININGIQNTVPSGMITDFFGNCMDPNDDCPNLAGIQEGIPANMVINPSNGWCVYQIEELECPLGQVLVNGECVVPGVIPISCTVEQSNDITNIPCYCSAHPTVTTPVDCVQYCQDNPTACKKKPKYKEN